MLYVGANSMHCNYWCGSSSTSYPSSLLELGQPGRPQFCADTIQVPHTGAGLPDSRHEFT